MKSIKISCTSLYFGSDVSKWPIIITHNLYYAFILKVPKLGQLTLSTTSSDGLTGLQVRY